MLLSYTCSGEKRNTQISNISKLIRHHDTAMFIGEELKNLQVSQLKGERDKIKFCNDCSAPMVCCDENLDDHTEEILKKINI